MTLLRDGPIEKKRREEGERRGEVIDMWVCRAAKSLSQPRQKRISVVARAATRDHERQFTHHQHSRARSRQSNHSLDRSYPSNPSTLPSHYQNSLIPVSLLLTPTPSSLLRRPYQPSLPKTSHPQPPPCLEPKLEAPSTSPTK